jgi:hypothetical protein
MKYFRLALAIFLVPPVIALGWNFFDLILSLGQKVSENAMPFWAGLGCYLIFQVVFFRPIRTYIFGHELTHAIVGLLSGARLKSFKVSSSGGSVVLSKTNVLIALAPYFIPLYALIIIFVYWAAGRFWPVANLYPYFLFAAGFSLSFHLSLTWYALSQGQSDLEAFGVFFSAMLILFVNFIALSALFRVLFPGSVDLRGFYTASFAKTIFIWSAVYERSEKLWYILTSKK